MQSSSVLERELTNLTISDSNSGVLSNPHRLDERVEIVGTSNGWAMRSAFFASDVLAFLIACGSAVIVSNIVFGEGWLSINILEFKAIAVLVLGLSVARLSTGEYGPIPGRHIRQFRNQFVIGVHLYLGLLVTFTVFGLPTLHLVLLLSIASFLAFLQAAFQRALCRIAFGKKKWWGTRFLIIGEGELAKQVYSNLRREPQWGLRPIGIVSDSFQVDSTNNCRCHYLGVLDHIAEISRQSKTNRAIFVTNWLDSEDQLKLVSRSANCIKQWIVLPVQNHLPSLWLGACEVTGLLGWSFERNLEKSGMLRFKRALDVLVCVCVGAAILPFIVILALLIKLSSKGPVFFSHERFGREGHRFLAWKFRTMYPNSGKLLEDYLETNPELAAEWQATHKLKFDPRVTWIGRTLRATSLDELPQIWNVILGDMSLVGPRPIPVDSGEVEKYGDVYDLYRKVRPGITGLWQVSGRNNTTFERRLELNAYYVQNWSIWLDLYILACTVKVVLLREGAY